MFIIINKYTNSEAITMFIIINKYTNSEAIITALYHENKAIITAVCTRDSNNNMIHLLFHGW